MDYHISPETFLRLSKAALQPDETHEREKIMRGVRIEYRDGVALAVASCGQIIVAECLPECGDNGEVTITIAQAMLDIAEAELAASGMLVITQAPGWTVARGVETGRMLPINAEIPGDWPDWRGLIPNAMRSKYDTPFVLGANWLGRMAETSPSGVIVLPKFADKEQPLIIRDLNDPNWFGLILLAKHGKVGGVEPAEIPEWIK